MRQNWVNRILLRGRKQAQPTAEPHAFIEMNHLVKVYESPAGGFQALRDVSIRIDAGEFVAIVGKSGSGKSTLLNMITGIDRPTSGEIIINEVPIHQLSEEKLTAWRGDNIGIVFQFFQLIPTMTLLENIMLPMDFCHKYPLRLRRERARQLLEAMDLLDLRDRLPSRVSGGQQQRAAIARALANDPPVIVADEPTGNLDSATAEAVLRLLERLHAEGKTVIMVTHDLDIARCCDRTISIADGRIVEDRYLNVERQAQSASAAATGQTMEPVEAGTNVWAKG